MPFCCLNSSDSSEGVVFRSNRAGFPDTIFCWSVGRTRSSEWAIPFLRMRGSLPSAGTNPLLLQHLILHAVNNLPSFFVLGVRFDPITADEAVERLDRACRDRRKIFCVTPNPEICLLATLRPEYLQLLNSSDLSVPDGFGILWAHRYLSGTRSFWGWVWTLFTPRKTKKLLSFPRVTGTDVMNLFCKQFPKRKIFLLGAAPEVNQRLAQQLDSEGVSVVGASSTGPSLENDETLCDEINASGAEVLFVAFGAPKQEEWIARNFSKLSRVWVAMGIGGAFDFLSGAKKRAPGWMQALGLEWLYRLWQEPKRLKRIVHATIIFPWKVYRS